MDVKTGYPGLSKLMGHADGLGMFKRFTDLNMRNLLYMQAELLALEDELEIATCNDHHDPNSPSRKLYSRSAKTLRASKDSSDPRNREQWDKVLEIREKLKEYSRQHRSQPRG